MHPNLEALADGRITHGTLEEYPLLRAEAKAVLAENAKLRDALAAMLGCTTLWADSDPRGTAHFLPEIQRAAREALGKS